MNPCNQHHECLDWVDMQTALILAYPPAGTYTSYAETTQYAMSTEHECWASAFDLVGRRAQTGEQYSDTNFCTVYKCSCIHADITQGIIRQTMDTYKIIGVQKWVDYDALLVGEIGG